MTTVTATIVQTEVLNCPEDDAGNLIPGCPNNDPTRGGQPCVHTDSPPNVTHCYVCSQDTTPTNSNYTGCTTYTGVSPPEQLWSYQMTINICEDGDGTQWQCSFIEQGLCPVVDGTSSARSNLANFSDSTFPNQLTSQSRPSAEITCTYPVTAFQTSCGVQAWINGINSGNSNSLAENTSAFDQIMQTFCVQSGLPPSNNLGCSNEPTSNVCPTDPTTSTQMPHCSRIVAASSAGNLCRAWVGLSDAGTYTGGSAVTNGTSSADIAMNNYCEGKVVSDFPECRCINRANDPIYQSVQNGEDVPDQCWWLPCSQQNSDIFLTPTNFFNLSVCPTINCGTTIKVNGTGGNVNISGINSNVKCAVGTSLGGTGSTNTGGGTTTTKIFGLPEKTVLYIGIGVAVVIVLIILYLLLKPKRRTASRSYASTSAPSSGYGGYGYRS